MSQTVEPVRVDERPRDSHIAPVAVSMWRPRRTGEPWRADLPQDRPADGVLWFDVDFQCDFDRVWEQLRPWRLKGLEPEMLREVLQPDPVPKVQVYGDESAGIRSVSVVGIQARSSPEDAGTDAVNKGQLVVQLVESLVGESWIITCWHPSRVCTGARQELTNEPPVLRAEVRGDVYRNWIAKAGRTSGDIGIYIARSLVDTYPVAHRAVEGWLESWEHVFFCNPDSLTPSTVNDLLALVSEFRRRLSAFNHARRATTDRNWLPWLSDPAEAEDLDEVLDRALEKLGVVVDTLRTDMDLWSMRNIDAQLTSARAQQESSEALHHKLAIVSALLLVPTLVATIYGANTQLPGINKWLGFDLMLALMVISGLAFYMYLNRAQGGKNWSRRRARHSHRE